MNIRKRIAEDESAFMRDIKSQMKQERCVLCGRKMESAKHSHVVPQFILKNIAENGKIAYGHIFHKKTIRTVPKITGIRNAYVFKLLCEECENKSFANYENPTNLENFDHLSNELQQTILYEMTLKANLANINMKFQSLITKNYASGGSLYAAEKDGVISAERIDINEHFETIRRLRRATKRRKEPFIVLYNKLLDYQVQFAAQTLVCYIFDLKKNCIFNANDMRPENKCQYFYIMIFPLKGKTRILFYTEKKGIESVSSIVDDFKSMSDEEKLHFIFVSLIIHSEIFYVTPSFAECINRKDKSIKRLYTKTDLSGPEKLLQKDGRIEIANFKKYTNYLSKEFAKPAY